MTLPGRPREIVAVDGHLSLRGEDEMRYAVGDRDDAEAELIFIFPLQAPVDTITLAQDVLTWEYNLRSDPGNPTDLLRFRRLAEGQAEGPVCALQ